MRVQEILTENPEVSHPDDTIAKAALRMKNLDVGLLPVCDGTSLLGVLTDRDIVLRAVAEGRDPSSTLVKEIMTTKVAYCFTTDSVREVADLMEERQVRRLPVLDKDHTLVGIVSLGDIAVRTHKEKLAGEVLERVSEPVEPAFLL
jgi:CBS domain-containing protein